MAKGKRVNPRRIPLAKDKIDKAAIINDVSYANLYYAWLLVLYAMLEQEAKTPDEVKRLWNAADRACVEEGLKTWEIHDAEQLMGLKEPHPNLNMYAVRSLAELEAFKRKARENAVFIALCSICLGLDNGGLLDKAQLRRVFANVSLTLAEIESSCTSYDQLAADITRHGLSVNETDAEISLSSTET